MGFLGRIIRCESRHKERIRFGSEYENTQRRLESLYSVYGNPYDPNCSQIGKEKFEKASRKNEKARRNYERSLPKNRITPKDILKDLDEFYNFSGKH